MGTPIDAEKNHKTESSKSIKYKGNYKWIVLCCLIVTLMVCIIIAVIFLKFRISSGTVTITNAFVTSGLDKQGQPLPATSNFPPDQPAIYCAIIVSTPEPVQIGVRWYFDNELIYVDHTIIKNNWIFFIRPNPGLLFKKGDYRVEIYLVKDPIRIVYFTVK